MGKKRLIKVIDLLLIFALAVGINLEFFIMPTLSAPPYDGDWLINTDSTFSGETYNMYYDIIINSGINVEFKSCTDIATSSESQLIWFTIFYPFIFVMFAMVKK